MEFAREQWLLFLSTPLYVIVIGAEILLSHLRHKGYYTLKGTLQNLYLMLLNMGLDVLMLVITLGVLEEISVHAFFRIETAWVYWVVLLIFEDFMFYWLHYIDHYVRLFWAVHVTHHNSQEFNLTVGFRSSVFQPLYRFIYFIPIALCGFEPIDIMFMYSATQIYGILIHTQSIGKLGFLEWFMATPSHHRVHHGANPQYLDKNMGMIFIIWDRIFGTFEEEKETIRYGLTKPISEENPVSIIFHEWAAIVTDVTKSKSLKNKLLYIFGPPGWSHDGSRKTSRQLEREFRSSPPP